MSLSVSRIHKSGLGEVIALLAEAFAEDPVLSWLLPEHRNSAKSRRRFFSLAARIYARDGIVEATGGLEAAALWGRPGRIKATGVTGTLDGLRGFVTTLVAAGSAMNRAARIDEMTRANRPQEPHWYLSAIGTNASHRQRGAASVLLESRLAECDVNRALAYLESSSPANLSLYRRHGFEVIRKVRVDDSPPLWLMSRSPR